jgi:hypothetical protein
LIVLQKSGACVTVCRAKRQTLTIAAIHDQHYVQESGRLDSGSESFHDLYLRMASLPSLVYGFHEHIEPVRGHAPQMFFFFLFSRLSSVPISLFCHP